MSEEQVEKMQEIIKGFVRQHHYISAIFWLDKLLIFTPQAEEYLLLYLECLYCTGQYMRSLSFISYYKLENKSFRATLMCAKCYYEAGHYNEALSLLSSELIQKIYDSELLCGIYLTRGKIAEAKEERELAIQCYDNCLRVNPTCYESVERLMRLTGQASIDLHLEESMGDSIKDVYRTLYSKRAKLDRSDQFLAQISENSVDGMLCSVKRLFDLFLFNDAYNLSQKILARDFYNYEHLSYYVGILYKLNKEIEMYSFIHKVMKLDNEITWYSIGMYYMMRNNAEMARKFFKKVTDKNPSFVFAWMCMGHTYSMECEHDQAISVYLSAVNNSKCHKRALISVATEYFNLDNFTMAANMLKEALIHLPDDPLVVYELAVIDYKRGRYVEALNGFNRTKSMAEERGINLMDVFWEPLYNNIGFCCRKLGAYDKAIESHLIGLTIKPISGTYSAIAFNYCRLRMHFKAIDYLHKALSLKRDDVVANKMLNFCINTNLQFSPLMDMPEPLGGKKTVDPLTESLSQCVENKPNETTFFTADDINLSVTSPVVVLDESQ